MDHEQVKNENIEAIHIIIACVVILGAISFLTLFSLIECMV